MFSWSLQASAETTATAENIWKLWSDVTSWATWDEVIEWCKLKGQFQEGKNTLKPQHWPASQFRLTYVEPNKKYKDVARLPGTVIEFEYEVASQNGEKSLIQLKIVVKGMLAPLLRFTLRSNLQKDLQIAVSNLARMAEDLRL